MKYLQITFTLNPDTTLARELLIAMAGETGCDSFSEEENKVLGYCLEDNFDETLLKNSVENFILPDINIEYKIEKAEDKNWNEKWENTGFEPIIIDNKCIICSSKQENPHHLLDTEDKKNALIIRIDPKQAFGSGSHETTQMIIGKLLDMDLKNKIILDCGCGTGILSIVAAKQNAKEVCAYDIDEWSVKNTEYNAKLNNVKISIKKGNCTIIKEFNKKFDIIIANINRNILLADMNTFVKYMNSGATLILSGFYKEDIPFLEEKANLLGLKTSQYKENLAWCCLVFQEDRE